MMINSIIWMKSLNLKLIVQFWETEALEYKILTLELPQAVKMTVCPINKKMRNNFCFTLSYKFFLNL